MKRRVQGYVLLVVSMALLMVATATLTLFSGSGQALVDAQTKYETTQLATVLEAGVEHNLRNLYDNDQCTGYGTLGGTLGAVTYSATLDSSSSSPVNLTVTAVHASGEQSVRTRRVDMYGTSSSITLGTVADTKITEASPGSNFGSNRDMLSEATDTLSDQRALLRFDISTVPSSAIIAAASLQLFLDNNHGQDSDPDSAYRIMRDWNEYQASWYKAASGGFGFWISEGGDYDPYPYLKFVDSAEGVHLLDLTRLARLWHGGVANYGILIRSFHHANSDDRHYRTREEPTASERPELTISYRCNCALGCV
ncbi:MAG: DNRLRE domain-containing protein [Pseudomonadales bacterium]